MARRKSVKKKSSYSGKRRSRFFIPWPYIFFLILCMGVLLTGWTFKAGADNLIVRAEVHAPLPTSAAIIETPTDGSRFTSVPITVAGSCPSDGSGAYIKLYRNDVFSGVAVCSGTNRFELQTDLFPGANKLMARIFNQTDDAGPDSNTPVVYYDIPSPPSGSSSPGAPQPTAPIAPFTINTNFRYIGYYVGQAVQWKLVVNGGSTPYAISVDWGDGDRSLISRKGSGAFAIEHEYAKPGDGEHNTYTVKITGSDSEERQAFIQLFALVNPRDGSFVGQLQKPPGHNWLLLAWPAYLVIVLMLTSYYLGEREELLKLRKRGVLRRRRV